MRNESNQINKTQRVMLPFVLIDDFQLKQHQYDPRWNGSFRGSSEQFNKQELFSVQKPGLQVT